MKLQKIILINLLFLAMVTMQAQVTIGSGAEPNKAALLDLKTQEAGTVTNVTDDSNITSTSGGLLLPRVKLISLTSLEPFITNATDEEKLKHAGLVVHNLNETNGMQHATYQWDGSQWKLFVMDTEWSYDATQDKEQVYLKRSNSRIGEFGADIFINKDGSMENSDQSMATVYNTYSLLKRNASGITQTTTSASPSLDFNTSYLLVDNDSPYRNYNGLRANAMVPEENTKSYGSLYGIRAAASAAGTGNVDRVYGAFNGAENAGSGTAGFIVGSFNQATQLAGSTGNIASVSGTRTFASMRASAGNVTSVYGLQSYISFESGHASPIEKAYILGGNYNFHSNNTKINTLYGLDLNIRPSTSTGTPTINQAYGIYLSSVDVAGTNYGIYTNKGQNRLGDILQIHSSNTSTNPDNSEYPLRLLNNANSASQVTGIEFWNSAIVKNVPTARIITQMNGNSGKGDNIHFQTQSDDTVNPNKTSPTTKMTISANGNVGIGNTSPTVKLDINTGGTAASPIEGFKLVDGNQAESKVLASDVNGAATWKYPSLPMVYYRTTTAYSEIQPTSNIPGASNSYYPFFFKANDEEVNTLNVVMGTMNPQGWTIQGNTINQVNSYFDLPEAGDYVIEVSYSPIADWREDLSILYNTETMLLFKNLMLVAAQIGSTDFMTIDVNRMVLNPYAKVDGTRGYSLNANPSNSYFIITLSGATRIAITEYLLEGGEAALAGGGDVVDNYRFSSPSGSNKLYNMTITKVH
ncbi:hypothetical protein M2451_003685 [Dysgonomonas sp. PFB1-18]|uniref:hypothetical protein n=1 Tax=unclassified Dysgonomonas TaxID=2630389 RepID=UPI0024760CDE|nr:MULTISPECIES: hypothetical protein [unclassified Dysgonomonas]MDH6310874.1 hypothetical protein [Dysgonomonas sp. PF1-14]MDH6340688.1 hypothetical protein [Dysgonomonas sp. PF1-16]MDH6382344.1 hypothetical protein [Dysgonomonas sp. PFB1-18]MDH6399694.1 hypothetical protein [Dysgonomonas sp. PF1-23]